MRVILFILLTIVAALVLVDRTNQNPIRATDGPVTIEASPLVLDSANPARTRLGELQFLGAWQLASPNPGFGGLSSIAVQPDSTIRSLNDSGVMFMFPQPGNPGPARAMQLRPAPMGGPGTDIPTDSESMAVDPHLDRMWVGYEMAQRICRFSLDLRQTGTCKSWKEFAKWPATESLETLVRLPGGSFLVISEGQEGPKGGREAMLFRDDPVEADTPEPFSMTYVPPAGYSPTDGVWIGGDRLLILNRRATIYDGFTAIVTLIDIRYMRPGAVLKGREVARLTPPALADNFEGLALERRNGQRLLWVVSDDNHLFFQRTLLLKFALPESM